MGEPRQNYCVHSALNVVITCCEICLLHGMYWHERKYVPTLNDFKAKWPCDYIVIEEKRSKLYDPNTITHSWKDIPMTPFTMAVVVTPKHINLQTAAPEPYIIWGPATILAPNAVAAGQAAMVKAHEAAKAANDSQWDPQRAAIWHYPMSPIK